MRKFLGQLVLALILGGAPAAHAGLYFEETLLPTYGKVNPGTTNIDPSKATPDEKALSIPTRTTLGWIFGPGILVGGTLNYATSSTKNDAVVGGDSAENRGNTNLDLGPTVGYVAGGFHASFTYLLSAKNTVKYTRTKDTGTVQNDEQTVNKGTDIQFGVGYGFSLSTAIRVGPSVVFRSVSYDKQSFTDNLDATKNYTDTALSVKAGDMSVLPMLTLMISL